MVFKTITMTELRKSGGAPGPTAMDSHRDNIGKGSYNRFQALDPRARTFSTGKRRLPADSSPVEASSKSPRLDSNALFDQMRAHEEKLKSAKAILDDTAKICDDAFQSAHGGIGKCVGQLITVVGLLLSHQEGLSSSVIDSCKVFENKNSAPQTGTQGHNPGNSNTGKKTPSPDEIKAKRVKQAIHKAEKTSVLYELNLGPVPIINKETLTRKVTLALHENAGRCEQVSGGSLSPADAEEMIDDMLTCASLDFLGNGSSKFRNEKDPSDPRIGKMCTLPVKLIFKGKDERMRAEQTLRKVCNTRCSTPYPKKLRSMIRDMIEEGKGKQPGHFVRVRVHPENLKMDAFASIDGKWVDLKLERDIPLDILDNAEISAVEAEGEMETNIS
jgi:hypothetical protein